MITAAALIMVFVFGSFVLNGDPTVKQFGIGLAVAVILDATVVRCLLVPALMILMGKINWYMPRWLDRLVPHISIEGAEFFAAATGVPRASRDGSWRPSAEVAGSSRPVESGTAPAADEASDLSDCLLSESGGPSERRPDARLGPIPARSPPFV